MIAPDQSDYSVTQQRQLDLIWLVFSFTLNAELLILNQYYESQFLLHWFLIAATWMSAIFRVLFLICKQLFFTTLEPEISSF